LESLVGPLGYWNQLQRYQFRVLTMLGLETCHSLLDIGCGPLQGGIAFIRYLQPSCYVGVDHNPEALEAGRMELSRHRLWSKNPSLLFSRSFGDDEVGDARFNFIWLSQILYYFDEPTLDRLFEMAKRRLLPGGILAGDIHGPCTDRSFLRDPKPPVHTPESLNRQAASFGLQVKSLGTLNQLGYPKQLNLGNNLLIKATSMDHQCEGGEPHADEVN
jgi:SAM-dependent methyltransferase